MQNLTDCFPVNIEELQARNVEFTMIINEND